MPGPHWERDPDDDYLKYETIDTRRTYDSYEDYVKAQLAAYSTLLESLMDILTPGGGGDSWVDALRDAVIKQMGEEMAKIIFDSLMNEAKWNDSMEKARRDFSDRCKRQCSSRQGQKG